MQSCNTIHQGLLPAFLQFSVNRHHYERQSLQDVPRHDDDEPVRSLLDYRNSSCCSESRRLAGENCSNALVFFSSEYSNVDAYANVSMTSHFHPILPFIFHVNVCLLLGCVIPDNLMHFSLGMRRAHRKVSAGFAPHYVFSSLSLHLVINLRFAGGHHYCYHRSVAGLIWSRSSSKNDGCLGLKNSVSPSFSFPFRPVILR